MNSRMVISFLFKVCLLYASFTTFQDKALIKVVNASQTYRSNELHWAKFRPNKSHRNCQIHQASIVVFDCMDEYKMYQRDYLIQNSNNLMNPSYGVARITAIHKRVQENNQGEIFILKD